MMVWPVYVLLGYGSFYTAVVAVTDLNLIDSQIMAVYEHPSPALKQQLMENIQLYLITLRRFNTMTRRGCTDTKEQAADLVHSGGPIFLKNHAFYSDEEQALRNKINFTDYQFQEYQYYRIDSENEWNELQGQIKELDGVQQNYTLDRFDHKRFSLFPVK